MVADRLVDAPATSTTVLPAGTVTFLLTDVEGSSRLWEADPETASVALARRQEIIRDATFRHGGALPLEQGEGDSTVSVFARASDAAACAIDIQLALGMEAWPAGADVRVRIALHTGEAEPPTDGAYRGGVLNRCARLRSIGHGGQILASQATYEVLVDGLSDDVALRDLGVHRLRDLARPEHVWQVRHPELPDAFPPLRSLDAVANNLPVQLTSFVGRETETAEVHVLLGERRLVTLTGAGGSGKTRLALQIAAGVADDHPDGIWWVDLAPLADPALVPAALAAVLGVRESPLEPITDTVVRYLSSRRALVALDNCEHLIESCAALAAQLIQGCPAVTLVATSREPLRVEGETVWATPSLSLPEDGSGASLVACEAVRLFVDRALASQPKFSLTEDNALPVGQICSRLDGIPLAIELAAARTRVLTVDEIADGLADRFHLLTGGARTALPRQRTLESSVDWSHDLLDDEERVVFRRSAVFAGSFTREAAEAVCGDEFAAGLVLDLLSGLVDRSLVQIADEAGSRTRYRMLETIRDYARHKLTDAREAEATRERHLDHYVSFAERAAVGLEGPDLVGWLARIDAELDNLRAALDWSPRSAGPDRGARVVGLLCLYWFARSELGIGRARLEATLDAARRDGPERADVLGALCMVSYRASDMDSAARYGDEAIALARGLGDASRLARALHWRAWVAEWGEGDHLAAWEGFEEAATLLRQTDDRVYRPLNLAMYGWSCVESSEMPRARALLDEGLALTDAAPAPHARCYCLVSLGFLCSMEGRLEDAGARLNEALTLAQGIRDHYAEICARLFLVLVELGRGRLEDARALCEQGLEIALKHRSPNCEGFMRMALGQVALIEGRLDDAATELGAAFELPMPVIGANCRVGQAGVALARSQLDEARRLAEDAIRLGRETDFPIAIEGGLAILAALARLEGDPHRAEDLLHDALDLASPTGHRAFMPDILEALGGVIADQGRFEEAARLLAAAQRLGETIGTVLPWVQRQTLEGNIVAVREGLGADAFEDAWRDGARLTLDEAVAYARRGRGKRKRPPYGWNSLTPTELQVVELVAEGLTNPQIGDRLFISARTVQTHLAHAFAKLGVSTRAALAAATARRRAAHP